MSHSIFVVREPVGYVRMTRDSKWSKSAARYFKFKQDVAQSAKMVGMRLPLVATRRAPVMVITACSFVNMRSPDPGNVQKAVEDALFYKSEGGDKHVAGLYWPAEYGSDINEVEIMVMKWHDPALDDLRNAILRLATT